MCLLMESFSYSWPSPWGVAEMYTEVCLGVFFTSQQFNFTRQHGSQSLTDIFLILLSLSVLVCACV